MSQQTQAKLKNMNSALLAVRNASVFDITEKAVLLAEATREVLRDLDARLAAIESGAAL